MLAEGKTSFGGNKLAETYLGRLKSSVSGFKARHGVNWKKAILENAIKMAEATEGGRNFDPSVAASVVGDESKAGSPNPGTADASHGEPFGANKKKPEERPTTSDAAGHNGKAEVFGRGGAGAGSSGVKTPGQVNEEELTEAKPSAGLSKATKSEVEKKAHKGEKVGHGNFDKVANKAAKEYGSKEAGKKVAAAAMWKNLHKEAAEGGQNFDSGVAKSVVDTEKETATQGAGTADASKGETFGVGKDNLPPKKIANMSEAELAEAAGALGFDLKKK